MHRDPRALRGSWPLRPSTGLDVECSYTQHRRNAIEVCGGTPFTGRCIFGLVQECYGLSENHACAALVRTGLLRRL